MRYVSVRTLCLAAAIVLVASAQGQGRRQKQAAMGYDKQAETTITGTVQSVAQQQRGGMMGTHATVLTSDGQTVNVHLGPSDYLAQQQLQLQKGDSIQVTGARTTMGGQSALIARQVIHNNRTVTLRNEQGKPMWSGKQGKGMQRGTGQASRAMPYDTAAETTIRGTVDSVKVFSRPGMPATTHAMIRTAEGQTVTVELAPRGYLQQQQLTFNRGDQVEVVGARTKYGADEVIVARHVIRNNRTYTLRSAEGVPQWPSAQQGRGAAARQPQ